MLFHEEDIPFFSKEVVNLCLIFTHVKRVFFGTTYFAVTFLFAVPFSESFNALHFTLVGLLYNLPFYGTIFLSQRSKNGLFDFMTLCLCFQKSNAWFKNVGMFEFSSKSSNSIEKVRRDKKKFWVIEREIHLRDRQISSTYRDVRVFEYWSYRDFFCLKRVSRFKGPTNLLDLPIYFSFLEL